MVGRTSLMIAHRLSTVRGADQIIVVNRGRIAETGSHEELLTKGGLYYQLYQAQLGEIAEIEAEHLRRRAESGELTEAGNGHHGDNGSGEDLQREIFHNLARAVRMRIRASLQDGGGGAAPRNGTKNEAVTTDGDESAPSAPEAEPGPGTLPD
jgi:ABC-type multidrug transport system ATPase subunit